jgi:hypothetical protein
MGSEILKHLTLSTPLLAFPPGGGIRYHTNKNKALKWLYWVLVGNKYM